MIIGKYYKMILYNTSEKLDEIGIFLGGEKRINIIQEENQNQNRQKF